MTVVTSFNDCKNARTTKAMLTNRPASGTPPIKDSTERDCILFRLSTNTAPDSRVSFVVCHLDSRDFTLNLNCTTSEVQIFCVEGSRVFSNSCFGIQDFSFCDFQISAPSSLFVSVRLLLSLWDACNPHPIFIPSSRPRAKESQHELLIFPPLFEFCKQEGGKWNTLGELGYPIEMLGFSQHYIHKGSPTPALLLYCHAPRLFCKHFNVTT